MGLLIPYMRASLTLLGIVGLTCQGVLAEPVWDDTVLVPAIKSRPGQWLTCPKGSAFRSKGGAIVDKQCYDIGFIQDRLVGESKSVSLQELLDLHFTAPAGHTGIAVGPIPVLIIGATGNYYDQTKVFIAYRLSTVR